MINSDISLQEQYAPNGICFGCGCKNPKGLQIKSFAEDDKVISKWHPEEHHQAFPGVLNGGIIGSILDCHSNWAAAYYLMQSKSLEVTPCTVTAEYTIKLRKPAPLDTDYLILAELTKVKNNKAWIDAELTVDKLTYASCSGLFVAVGEDHPAYHRW